MYHRFGIFAQCVPTASVPAVVAQGHPTYRGPDTIITVCRTVSCATCAILLSPPTKYYYVFILL